MVEDDLLHVLEIEKLCFSDPWCINMFQEAVYAYECLVLTDLDSILGFFIGFGVLDEYEIYNVVIRPDAQSKGYGKYLMKYAILQHNGRYNKYFLEVRKSNLPAISLYKSIGFNEIYVRKDYYKKPVEDAIVFLL